MTVTVNFEGIDFEVSGNYEPLVRGKLYLANGDPGYPDEGGYFELDKVEHKGENFTKIMEPHFEALEELAYEAASE